MPFLQSLEINGGLETIEGRAFLSATSADVGNKPNPMLTQFCPGEQVCNLQLKHLTIKVRIQGTKINTDSASANATPCATLEARN